MKKKYKSNIKKYIGIWFTILITAIVLYFKYNSKQIVLLYFIVTLLLATFMNLYESQRIMIYLKNKYEEEYKNTKTFLGIEGIHNGFNAVAFVFSNNHHDDIELAKLKLNYKQIIWILLALFLSYIIFAITIVFTN